jgi:high-affinity iron transporter
MVLDLLCLPGSVIVFSALAFVTVYREGFETVLFYQAMFSFARYMELYVILGMVLGLAVIVGVAILILLKFHP